MLQSVIIYQLSKISIQKTHHTLIINVSSHKSAHCSQLDIVVSGLFQIASDLCVEQLFVSSADKYIFEVDFCLLHFRNVFLVLCAVGCDDMRTDFLLTL